MFNLITALGFILFFVCYPVLSLAQVHARAAYSAISPSSVLLSLSQDSGFFKQEGLNVEVLYIQGGSMLVPALLSGEILISTQGGPAVVQAGMGGTDLVFIGSMTNGLVDALVARPGIANANDLKGKKIGITRFGSALDFLARIYIRELGLSPERDVIFIQSGGAPQRLAALRAGVVDAAILNPELSRVVSELGFKVLLDPDEMARFPWQHTGVVTSRSLAQRNKTVMRPLFRALVRGIHRFRTDETYTLKVLARFLRQDDTKVLKATYKDYLRLVPWPPYPSAEGINVVLKELGTRAKGKKPSDFIDASLLDELEQTNFFKTLK